jgi:signal peptide peptidase SppA
MSWKTESKPPTRLGADERLAIEGRVPHLEQYAGLWSICESEVPSMLERVQGVDVLAHIAAADAEHQARIASEGAAGGGYELVDAVAVIDLVGMMTKYGSSLSAMRRGTIGVRRAIRNALAAEEVNGLFVRADSGGGTIKGTFDLADDLAAAAKIKPVVAFIEDMAASAAYLVVSQAPMIIANHAAVIGSIGAYTVVEDWSAAAATRGVKVHAVKSARYKAIGVIGTEVSAEQLGELQRNIDEVHVLFVAAVARGRRVPLTKAEEWGDGAVHIGERAREIGLVDAIGNFDAAMTAIQRKIGRAGRAAVARTSGPNVERRIMAEVPKVQVEVTAKNAEAEQPSEPVKTADPKRGPVAATVSELKAALPDSSAEFREGCQERKLTLAQAKDEWLGELRKQNEELRAKAAKPGSPAVGVTQSEKTSGGESSADGAIGEWNAEVGEVMDRQKCSRSRAIGTVQRARPDLHAAYLEEYNRNHGRRVNSRAFAGAV